MNNKILLFCIMTFQEWCSQKEEQHPQFSYWNKVLELELLLLQFLRAQRNGNFPLYVETLGIIVQWMFATDHIHYARWLTIHVRDLLQLSMLCPEVYEDVMNGHFVT